ncbi:MULTISPECIES: N-acetylmuramoyl-L-alanine amidase [Pontibacter]|uniref:N-acetylmuramoyl-L-alanine amidase n=1 Tax=Pontibacter lucknowensis TaxID=1077936 RepID=A0A1N6X1D8_9BACT|nr:MULTISPECIES: N-acetylmuramoyl-L-alanine amidase [Pontibacter]EJF08619.1 N-acetylmuramoyl-L-alanine amidase [Pontibacter sp. BAB1700]SIQ96116.1 N-acetylmuramoyl-L-alanine amidase [Pontibacter lucknowensis]
MPINLIALRTSIITLLLFLSSIAVFGQSSNLQVVAMPGDGIYTLLRRHGLNPSEHLQKFVEMNKERFGKDNGLIAGKEYTLPEGATAAESNAVASDNTRVATEVSKTRSDVSATPAKVAARVLEMPLFGEKYSRVELKSSKLQGAVYYLSSGHGGPDPGAVGKYGNHDLAEDEYAYDVTIRLARVLMEHGATVYMIVQDPENGIRDEGILKMDRNEVVYPNKRIPLNHSARLRQRTEAVNSLYLKHKGAYQRMLAIHVDSRSESQNIDVFFYHHENSKDGEQLAKNIHQTFTNKYRRYQPNRDYSGNVTQRSSLYVIKYSHPPTVFIELGNIRNVKDQRRFVIPDNRQALANWIYEGLLSDYTPQ